MSGGAVNDFPVGSELELDLGDGWRWYAFMHKFNTGGGWVREIYEDGTLDNRREGIQIVPAIIVARSSRNVPRKIKGRAKARKFTGGDPLHK